MVVLETETKPDSLVVLKGEYMKIQLLRKKEISLEMVDSVCHEWHSGAGTFPIISEILAKSTEYF